MKRSRVWKPAPTIILSSPLMSTNCRSGCAPENASSICRWTCCRRGKNCASAPTKICSRCCPTARLLRQRSEQELARCHRDQRTVGVILLDIDHFKKINDTYGHFAGDAVLRETAARLRGNMRPYDQVGRYGGEEFLVVLPNCDLEQAAMQAERMRHKLHSSSMIVDGAEMRVSASFGVTVSDGSERSPDVFVRVADEALYRAKADGRNCVSSLTLEIGAAAFP